MIEVMIIEKQSLLRKGIKHIISHSRDFSLGLETGCFDEGLKAIKELRPSICFLGLSSANIQDCTDLIMKFKKKSPETKWVIVYCGSHALAIHLMMQVGVTVFLSRNCRAEEVLLSAMRAYQSIGYLSVDTVTDDFQVNYKMIERKFGQKNLSYREKEVFTEIVAGKKIQEISKKLNLSPKTVSTYRARLLQKLGLDHEIDLIYFAVRNGFVAINKDPQYV